MTRRWSGALIVAVIVSAGGPAFGELACPEASNNEERRTFAREHFGAAQEAYDAGRPLASLEHYRCSNRQVPHPDTLYNIGVLAEGIGQLETARDAYEDYLERYPDSEARGDVQTRLRNVQERIPDEPSSPSQPQPQPTPTNPAMPMQPIQFQPQPQQLQSLQPVAQPQPYVGQPQPATVQPQPPVPRRRRTAARVAAIVTLPVGLVMTALGGGLYGAAVVRNDNFQTDIDDRIVNRDWLEEEARIGRRREVSGWTMMGLGATTVVTSIVLFAVFPRFRSTETPASSDTSAGTEGTEDTEGSEGTETPAATSSRSRGFAAIAAPFFSSDGGLGLSMTGRF